MSKLNYLKALNIALGSEMKSQMKERLLIIGCGDIARRALPALLQRYEIDALTRSADDAAKLNAQGVNALHGDLDQPNSLTVIARRADLLLHLAPPENSGDRDLRTRNLIAHLSTRNMLPRKAVYISTSGVYGDCQGAWIDESRPVNPRSARALRRVDAENTLAGAGMPLCVLRVPGIYCADRLPLERLRRSTPVLREEDDVYTNHIHAEDLANAIVAALADTSAHAIYNISDDSVMKMGEWFDLIADRYGLPRPPRISRVEAQTRIPPLLLSFMSESRRLSNRNMKAALQIRLRYPTVRDGVPGRS
jgi:nucleoside-diphosphate-sugar epimerase